MMSFTRKLVGANIRHYRKKMGLTQSQLAELANSADTYIGAIERGETNFTIETLERICCGLNVDVGSLFKPISIPSINKTENIAMITKKLAELSSEEVETVNDIINVLMKSFDSNKQ